ncbi:hypothetical protein M2349_001190 [Caldanaerobacter subterraneus subsp. tengcongensis MB4]|uniref:Uncharacterized protein n=1 Tax=Caldanaerobacter subterraneus subsp. tengcongensis (strain DSM 15242 / JCM 11007 / NBRC 100824 / MB4) TaxID=273068 RepID=Q8RAP2_CALS4|nr:hypothetical protein [Caldanaerobacter subterraneus]AAM24398.1 hypothetical protein TTE1167 [Caldanaerobacter subterraneus subsp. tengcongensis MB4]MCS3916049.1 hypothetical protein [Caldanaerobacter subterraneus subsp. tengcongensis MB4]
MEYLIEGYNKEIGNEIPNDVFPITPCDIIKLPEGPDPCVCWGPYCWVQACRPKMEPYYGAIK